MDPVRDEPGRALIMRFFEAADRGDIDAMREIAAEDVTMAWPQARAPFAES